MNCPICHADSKNEHRRILTIENKDKENSFPKELKIKVDPHISFRRYVCDAKRHIFYTREEIILV